MIELQVPFRPFASELWIANLSNQKSAQIRF